MPKSVYDSIPNISDIGKGAEISLSPTDTQDLITQLNKNTYTPMADGSLRINQQIVDLTNSIKQSSSDAFGKQWDSLYSRYSKGISAVKQLKDIVNLDPQATASNLNSSINNILKLTKTPEGTTILKQSIEELKNAPGGIDLTNPIKAIQDIVGKQVDLEVAQGSLTKAEAEAAKGSYVRQILNGVKNPSYVGRRLVGGAITVGVLYPAIKAISRAISGK